MKYISDKNNIVLFLKVVLSILVGFLVANYSTFIGLLVSVFFSCVSIYSFLSTRDKRISELKEYIIRLNNNEFVYDIEQYQEGEISKLYSELNKTTVKVQTLNNNLLIQQRQMEKALEDISHQLKTPISSLLLLNELQDPNDELTVKSKGQLHRLSYLSDSLLKLVKLDSGIEQFIVEKVSTQLLLDEIFTLVEPEVESLVNISNDTEYIYCDKHKTVEAIINIINNKIRYAEERIDIKVTEDLLNTKISICDDGEEISFEEREKIFERFYSGIKRNSQSIGIGLSITKEYLNKQNVRVTIEDKNTFVLIFPKF